MNDVNSHSRVNEKGPRNKRRKNKKEQYQVVCFPFLGHVILYDWMNFCTFPENIDRIIIRTLTEEVK